MYDDINVQVPEILEVKFCYVVETNTDLTEGRGFQFPLYVCESETTAIRMARGRGVQGCPAQVERRIMLRLKSGWLAPVEIHRPSEDDKAKDKQIAMAAEAEAKKLKVIEKVKGLGFSDEEIQILMGVVPRR